MASTGLCHDRSCRSSCRNTFFKKEKNTVEYDVSPKYSFLIEFTSQNPPKGGANDSLHPQKYNKNKSDLQNILPLRVPSKDVPCY